MWTASRCGIGLASEGGVIASAESIPEGVRPLLEVLLRYLVEHPEAKDSLEGIHQWWLPRGGVDWDVGKLEEAIGYLLARQWMEQTAVGERRIFGVCRTRHEEMSRALSELEAPLAAAEDA